ncbi:MAG: hypothetical protein R3F24_05125 [Gammaproteobacteria bacterium]
MVKRWVHRGRTNGMVAGGVVGYAGHRFLVDEAGLVAWLAEHPEPPPRPPTKKNGLSLQALADQRPPKLLPVLLEKVPARGRHLSVWEVAEIRDWGLNATATWRVAPTKRPGEFSLWKYSRPGSYIPQPPVRIRYRATYAPGLTPSAGTWTDPD